MRARQDAQSTVGLIGVVEVEPHAEHLLEKCNGRLDVRNAVLCAPRTETGYLGSGANRQRQILVPRNQPIRVGRLVEVKGANWKRLRRKIQTNEVQGPSRTSEFVNGGQREKTAPPGTGNRAERGQQLPLLMGLDNARDDRESVLLDIV